MEQLTKKQKAFLALGKRMKKVIALSKNLPEEGHPIVNKWVDDVEKVVYRYSETLLLRNIWRYQNFPEKNDLFDILTYLRRLLKAEGIFSEEFVE